MTFATATHTDVRPVLHVLEAMHAVSFGVVEATFITESGSSYAIRKTNTRVEFITDSKSLPMSSGKVTEAVMVHGRLRIHSPAGDITTSRVIKTEFHTA